jgi:hypothetical protein
MSDVCAIPGYVVREAEILKGVLAGFPTASARYCGDVEVFEITVRYKGKEATAQISRDGVRRYTASEITAYFMHPLMDAVQAPLRDEIGRGPDV